MVMSSTTATYLGSSVLYHPVLSGYGNRNLTEAEVQVKWKHAGIFSNFGLRVITNTHANARTYSFRKNGANGNQTISVGAGLTGWFEDNTNTDTVAVDDLLSTAAQIVAGGGSIATTVFRHLFAPTDTTKTIMCYGSTDGNGAVSLSTSRYFPICGIYSENTATESLTNLKIKTSGTFKYAGCYLTANAKVNNVNVVTRKNTANANIAIPITALTTGAFYDDTNSDSVVSGDLYNWNHPSDGTTLSQTFVLIYVFWESTDNTYHLITAKGNATSVGNVYLAATGSPVRQSTVSTDYQAEFGIIATISNMRVKYTANQDGTTDLFFNKNGTDQTLGFTNMTGASEFEDNTNTVSIIATDTIQYQSSGVTFLRNMLMLSTLVTLPSSIVANNCKMLLTGVGN
jgi:hypothetical protein